jgi:hypothetical protein
LKPASQVIGEMIGKIHQGIILYLKFIGIDIYGNTRGYEKE